MGCQCGNRIETALVCADCDTKTVVKHYKSRDALSAAGKERLACKTCGGTNWQIK